MSCRRSDATFGNAAEDAKTRVDSSVASLEPTPDNVSRNASTRLLVRFHWSAGARVALRANAMVAAIVVFLFGSAPQALTVLRVTILQFVSRGEDWQARMEFAAICVALAGVAMPRVTLGATGWMRSLPVSGRSSRRAAVVALCGTQAFAMVVAVLSIAGAAAVYHAPLIAGKIAGIPIIIVAAAMFVLPVRSSLGPMFALLAIIFAVPGHWLTNALAIVLLIVSDQTAGAIVPLRRRRAKQRKQRQRRSASKPITEPRWQWARLTLLALPKANAVAGFFLPVVFVAFGYFIVLNNPDLPHETALRTVRVSGSLSVLALASALSNSTLRSRPVWPWVRSLPWSARNRVVNDAVLALMPLLLVPLSLAPLVLGPALAVAATTPAIAAASAAALRAGAGRQSGAAGEVAIVAVIAGALIALWPLTSVLILLVAPAFVRLGIQREQRTGATRWDELHHDAAGDPAWLGAP